MKTREEILEQLLSKSHSSYDDSAGLMGEYKEDKGAGYHSEIVGLVHGTNKSAEYASALLYAKKTEYYKRAEKIFLSLAEIQDKDPQSKTFGLWPYYKEEPLKDMRAPDYNFSDFIGKHYIYALSQRRDCLSDEAVAVMKIAVRNAAMCSIKRNVSPDYSNISMMSSMTLISAGELLEDEMIFNAGKKRLQKAYKYNMYNGAFSEYNSSTYTPLVIAELQRMIMFFKDDECVEMASELYKLAWENMSLYYNSRICELSPPQKRCYHDPDDGQLGSFIYFATNGRYGTLRNTDSITLSYLTLPITCPEELMCNFVLDRPRFMKKKYYKRNNIRSAGEDTVIVRDLNSADLEAYTYMTEHYSMGAFDKSDMWNQRRTCSVIWSDGSISHSFRLRCLNNGYDYCSGVASATMKDNVIIGNIGFVTDHGDFHYILDKKISPELKTKSLEFVFELTGEGVCIERSGDVFEINDKNVRIKLKIAEWLFDGHKASIEYDRTRIVLKAYKGAEKTIDFNSIGECFGAFVMTVNCDLPQLSISADGKEFVTKVGGNEVLRFPSVPVGYNSYINMGGNKK